MARDPSLQAIIDNLTRTTAGVAEKLAAAGAEPVDKLDPTPVSGFIRPVVKGQTAPTRCQRCNDAPWSKRHRQAYYCVPCAALARADTCREFNVTPDIGFAVPVRRYDKTPDEWWVVCTTCPAEWVDTPGVQCWRCEERVARQIAAQVRTVLLPPDRDDPDAYLEWESRLQTAIELGLITRAQALDALTAAFRDRQAS